MSEVTQLLTAVEQGNSAAAERLLPLVYDELRRRAADRLYAFARAWLFRELQRDRSTSASSAPTQGKS